MNNKLILTALCLFLASLILYQRSRIMHYSHQMIALKKDMVKLEKEIYNLDMEIRELAPPATLYAYWKDNLHSLDYHRYENVKKKSKVVRVAWSRQ